MVHALDARGARKVMLLAMRNWQSLASLAHTRHLACNPQTTLGRPPYLLELVSHRFSIGVAGHSYPSVNPRMTIRPFLS
eukprot:694533-Amphidinium_carterae.1